LHDVDHVHDAHRLAGLDHADARVGEVGILQDQPAEFLRIDREDTVVERDPSIGPNILDANGADLEPHRRSSLGLHHTPRSLGSRARRRASPVKFAPSTASTIARPGNADSHQAFPTYARPSLTMPPQLGVGGCTPSPRNDSDDSTMISSAS